MRRASSWEVEGITGSELLLGEEYVLGQGAGKRGEICVCVKRYRYQCVYV